ncbi:MAG: hypothetical protein JNM66_02135 [Bryobacterales bacterium]|nr:hypothetical protein [Bryobacterales bacterium]
MVSRRSLLHLAAASPLLAAAPRRTAVSIRGNQFFINGRVTYKGRSYKGHKIEGLLMNSRMVQGTFDDHNPETAVKWAYPDTKKWDAERNVSEFLAAMPVWRKHGLLSFTVNLQGGSPEGYSKSQPWITSGIAPDGSLRPDCMSRLERILNRADELGMVAIVGYFYFGQDQNVKDEKAIRLAVTNATNWLLDRDYRNVLVEVDNETNVKAYDHEILKPARVHELIDLVKSLNRKGRRLLTGTSYGGNAIPLPNVVKSSDFLLLHGNGVKDPKRIAEMVRQTRAVEGYRPMPVLFNEDDHFDFDKPENNMMSAISEYASWGYFDPGASNYSDGYQCPPVNWGINTDRKKAFFNLLREVTGS